jgi:hypothetical protein
LEESCLFCTIGLMLKDCEEARIALMRASSPRDDRQSKSAMAYTAQQGVLEPEH